LRVKPVSTIELGERAQVVRRRSGGGHSATDYAPLPARETACEELR
jgi:hypothetical protein